MQTKNEIIEEVLNTINNINKKIDPEFLYANHSLSGPTLQWLDSNPEMKESYMHIMQAYVNDLKRQ